MTFGHSFSDPRSRRLAVFSLLIMWLQPLIALPATTVTDDNGKHLALSTPATRIISLSPHITELLFAVGAGQQIAGTIGASNYPAQAQQIRRIGDHHSLDIEAIMTLKPDLIMTWPSGNPAPQLQTLEHLGLPLFASDPRQLGDIPDTLIRLGRLTGHETQAAAQATKFHQRLQQLRNRYQNRTPVTVFLQIWRQPLMTVNGRHLISDVIRLCGGRNVFTKLDQLSPRVSTEAVLQADPDVIISTAESGENPPSLREWLRWPNLKAAKNGHLYAIEPDIISSHTLRILDGATRMCHLLEQVRSTAPAH